MSLPVDPNSTGLTLIAGAIGVPLALKILGPTASYIGDELQKFTRRRVENVNRIFEIAARKLGDKVETEGAVPPRVLKGILDDGSFCDDFLSAEYFGGVLASSRSGVTRDDRGAVFLSLLSRMSTYQIRTHYIIYSTLKTLFDGENLSVGIDTDRSRMAIYIPLEIYAAAMDFVKTELSDINGLVTHSILGLATEYLIDDDYALGSAELMRSLYAGATSQGIIVRPSALGLLLFLWAHGRSEVATPKFLNSDIVFEPDDRIKIPEGILKVRV